jgi:hypothetical protein
MSPEASERSLALAPFTMSSCGCPPDIRSHAGGMAGLLILSPQGRGSLSCLRRPPRRDAQPQRVQAYEARGIALVV